MLHAPEPEIPEAESLDDEENLDTLDHTHLTNAISHRAVEDDESGPEGKTLLAETALKQIAKSPHNEI